VLIVVFIILGLIAGDVAVGLCKSTGKGVVWDFGLGVIGAVLVGSLFSHIVATGSAGLNTATVLVTALTGAVALLATFHGLRDRRYRPGDPIRSDRISKIPSFKSPGTSKSRRSRASFN
jgi:uncharacterized membrane protein YeaQ/YmgE (transglycosylase-associated protein family)